tara:strand:- start:177 stop:524 length:348 start_codon:yes stop_codon:yes gene_type:complete
MLNNYPLFIIIFDLILGILFWTFIFKFFLHLFFANETNIKVLSSFFSITDGIYNKINRIIPKFLPYPLISIYLSWLIFILRFYILPTFTGLENIGNYVFYLEKTLIYYLNFNNLF